MKEQTYHVAEYFTSINGEGWRAGQPALFVRFAGCNLHCSYCDTSWANEEDAPYTPMSADDICRVISESGIYNVTLTGGEPLLVPHAGRLLGQIAEIPHVSVEIETNGSINIAPFMSVADNILFTVDYKLPGSGMEAQMYLPNFELVRAQDTVKFVSFSPEDLERAVEIIEQFRLAGRTHVYLSPVFGKIDPAWIVQFMLKHKLNQVNLQLQLHKYIWDPNARGV